MMSLLMDVIRTFHFPYLHVYSEVLYKIYLQRNYNYTLLKILFSEDDRSSGIHSFTG
jgi:hypothetical protein